MSFLGPHYLDLLPRLAEYTDDYPGLLKELSLCEPRAAIALYSNSSGKDPKGKKVTKTGDIKRTEDIEMENGKGASGETREKEQSNTKPELESPNELPTLDKLLQTFPAPPSPPPRHPELDLYFALYIWAHLALGEYLNAVAVVKRYGLGAPLFSRSPLVAASARAAVLFDPDTYAHTLEPKQEDRKGEAKEVSAKEYFESTRRVAALWDYEEIYALRGAYDWDKDVKESQETTAGGGEVAVGKLVDEALLKFRRTVHARIAASFGTVRPTTVAKYLGLGDVGDGSGVAVIAALERELGEEGRGWTVKSVAAEGNGTETTTTTELLVPPVQVTKRPPRQRSAAEKQAQVQELISAATHLEQRLGI